MNKIGIILCAYGNPQYLSPCLENWLKLKDKYNIKIATVNGQFKEMHELGYEDFDITTQLALKEYYYNKNIDFLYIQNEDNNDKKIYQTEAEIRDKALQWLLKENVDFVWLLDLDEFYTEQQIESIIEYINDGSNQFYCWWPIPMKNYIFSGKEYIKGFSPPRIFKTLYNEFYNLDKFYFDNDVVYYHKPTNTHISYKDLPSKIIPTNNINGGIRHMTWLHSNGKDKVNYQLKHFNGICSYKWNEEKKELEFDIDGYYKKFNISIPEIHKD